MSSRHQFELPFQGHSETSLEAAIAYASKASTARDRVLSLLQRVGADGLTDEEMQDALRMNPSTQRPRRIELARAGLLADSGRSRLTRAGLRAVVWIAARKRKDGHA